MVTGNTKQQEQQQWQIIIILYVMFEHEVKY